jgi:flavodoxin
MGQYKNKQIHKDKQEVLMKTLVTYFTQTGNTKQVAEAIYEAIPDEKEIKPLGELRDLEGYDLVFYGFPIQAGSPAKDAAEFLSDKGNEKRIALFMTHGAPEESERVKPWLEKSSQLASEAGAELLGLFDCQGEASQDIINFLLSSDDPERRMYGEEAAKAKGLPDEIRLERARAFAKKMMGQG